MLWIAWKMLVGNRVKYLGIVFGVVFAALLIAQQAAIFCGLMSFTVSQIRDVKGAEIWVMDRTVQYVDDVKPLADTALFRVKSVPGVAWAVRLYKGIARAKLQEGSYEQMILLGLDDATLVGAPQGMLLGSIADLRKPDAVIMDDAGYRKIWPGEPFRLGRTFEMNDRRAVLVGITRASRTFTSFPIVFTRYSQAVLFAPRERKVLSFVLAEPVAGRDAAEVTAHPDPPPRLGRAGHVGDLAAGQGPALARRHLERHGEGDAAPDPDHRPAARAGGRVVAAGRHPFSLVFRLGLPGSGGAPEVRATIS